MSVTPSARVACLLVLATGIATAPLASAPSRVALAVLLVALALSTRPRIGWLARRLGPALLALGALLVPLAIADPDRALLVALRAVGAAFAASCLASTLSLGELGPALRGLGVPRSLSGAVHALLWQLEHVASEGRRLVLARRLRGATRFGPEVLAQLLVRTSARAERVDLAMRLRGADGAPAGPRLGASGVLSALAALTVVTALHWLPS
ncbi:MAG: hypothetical protein IT377_19360 [Polyangiaceae bacterium]|nr:hypothetical protein [Polyangiaceae bacterium]